MTRRADPAVAAAQACLGYLLGGLGGCLVLLSRDLAVPRGQLAWLSAGFGVALLVSAPLAPALVAAGMALAGLGISVLYPLTLARLVQAPGLGLQHGSALGTAASGVAVLGAPIILDWIARRVGLRTAYLAALPALLAVVATQRGGARRR